MNRWKVAFFVSMLAWAGIAGTLAYALLDSGVTVAYMSDGYRDCELHRDLLDALLVGRVDRRGLVGADERLRGRMGAPSARDAEWLFDSAGRYAASRLGASQTHGMSR